MAVYTIKCFYNTGFNAINIPDRPSLLWNATSRTFPSNWLLQNKDLTSVRVNATWNEVENADYVAIGETYYFVSGVSMLTETCAELSLVLDAITTAGGIANLTIIDGVCERAHASSDGLFENVLAEPIAPSQNLQLDGYYAINAKKARGGTTIVTSTIDLENISAVAKGYQATGGSFSGTACYVPQVPAVTDAGSCNIFLPKIGKVNQELPNTGLYWLHDVKDAVQEVRSLGLDSAITGCYKLPYEWGSLANKHHEVSGVKNVNATNLKYRFGSANNAKVFAMHNTYTLTSIATGNSTTAEGFELYAGGSSPDVVSFSDPAPNGKPYAQFTYYKGQEQYPFANAVAGGTWLSTPIVYSQASGSLIQQKNFDRAFNLNVQGVAQNMASSTTSSLFSLVTGALSLGKSDSDEWDTGSLFGGATNLVSLKERTNYAQDVLNKELFEFTTNQTITVPTISFPQEASIQGYIGNGFLVYRTRLSDADVRRFDKFFTMYGYAQSKALEHSDFTNRRYFNFVKASGVQIKTTAGLRIRSAISNQLSTGVRVWHVLPNPTYYNNNPIG